MTKKIRQINKKTIRKASKLTLGALIALGLGSTLYAADCSHKANCSCLAPSKTALVRHELVPHVVLPETIQYKPVAQSQRRPNLCLDHPGDYGMASPYVATYVAYPSYQLPAGAEMRTVGQAVYPVSPKMLPLPLPSKKANENSALEDDFVDELVLEEKDSPEGDMDVAPILLASNDEEIVPATPLSELDNEVTQTAIFSQKPASPPSAWSFSSPLFKVARVPMGWNSPNHSGSISQYGPKGCMTQVGFQGVGQQPMDGMQQDPSMQQYGMMQPPMKTFQMSFCRPSQGPQMQMLPNGMMVVSMPSNNRCGIFGGRNGGGSPSMMILPGPGMGMQSPMMQPQCMMPGMMQPMMQQGMMPGMGMQAPQMAPQMMHPMMAAQMSGMMQPMQAMQNPMMPMQQMMQPQIVPVSAMTPYGMTIVGYRQVMAPAPMSSPTMMGYGMMNADYVQQMMQQQLAQQQMRPQQNPSDTAKLRNEKSDSKDEDGELKAPYPLNAQPQGMQAGMQQGMFPGMMADPYALYAQQVAEANNNQQQQTGMENMNGMNNPMMFSMPMMMPQMPNQCGQMYMTPYGMMVMSQPYGMGGMGNGMMTQPVGYGGMGGGMGMGAGNNMSMSDMIMLMTLMNNNNKPQRRFRLFERIAERRQARRDRNNQNDPLAQLMQMWSSPYSEPDTALRMPARNAYPYGFFGGQTGMIDTANYGGYYNLYMGNTSYPGLY